MKFISLSVLSLIIAISASGQYQYGIFAGPQITTAHYTANDIKQPTTNKYGFQLGLGLKIPFEDKLSFSPAGYYSMKGYKVKFNQYLFPPDANAIDNNTTIHTVETAFLLQYDFNREPEHFFIKLGPSLDFQLFGNEKYNTNTGTSVDQNMKFGYANYGHYSANMILQFGYEMSNGLTIYGQYSHGLSSINNADYGPMIRHRVYGISVGKYFHKK